MSGTLLKKPVDKLPRDERRERRQALRKIREAIAAKSGKPDLISTSASDHLYALGEGKKVLFVSIRKDSIVSEFFGHIMDACYFRRAAHVGVKEAYGEIRGHGWGTVVLSVPANSSKEELESAGNFANSLALLKPWARLVIATPFGPERMEQVLGQNIPPKNTYLWNMDEGGIHGFEKAMVGVFTAGMEKKKVPEKPLVSKQEFEEAAKGVRTLFVSLGEENIFAQHEKHLMDVFGYGTSNTDSAQVTLNQILDSIPQVVVLNWNPGMWEQVRDIAAQASQKGIKTVLITSQKPGNVGCDYVFDPSGDIGFARFDALLVRAFRDAKAEARNRANEKQ